MLGRFVLKFGDSHTDSHAKVSLTAVFELMHVRPTQLERISVKLWWNYCLKSEMY